jgi:hypothetical protein
MNIKIYWSLGAIHDGTGVASSCLTTNNYIMTAVIGSGSNATNLYYFSTCSINQFKAGGTGTAGIRNLLLIQLNILTHYSQVMEH